eukprot:1149422-Pelagomonas_calceolata.AAC.6
MGWRLTNNSSTRKLCFLTILPTDGGGAAPEAAVAPQRLLFPLTNVTQHLHLPLTILSEGGGGAVPQAAVVP